MPTSEIERAAAVLGPHATVCTVATAVGMETSALKQCCLEEGIRILASGEHREADLECEEKHIEPVEKGVRAEYERTFSQENADFLATVRKP